MLTASDEIRIDAALKIEPERYLETPEKPFCDADRRDYVARFFRIIEHNKDFYWRVKDLIAEVDSKQLAATDLQRKELEDKRREILMAIQTGNKILARVSPKYAEHLDSLRQAVADNRRKELAREKQQAEQEAQDCSWMESA